VAVGGGSLAGEAAYADTLDAAAVLLSLTSSTHPATAMDAKSDGGNSTCESDAASEHHFEVPSSFPGSGARLAGIKVEPGTARSGASSNGRTRCWDCSCSGCSHRHVSTNALSSNGRTICSAAFSAA
jgi:hypothetical protein